MQRLTNNTLTQTKNMESTNPQALQIICKQNTIERSSHSSHFSTDDKQVLTTHDIAVLSSHFTSNTTKLAID